MFERGRPSCGGRMGSAPHCRTGQKPECWGSMERGKTTLKRAGDRVRVRRAEKWLRSGRPARAVRALQRLTRSAWANPWIEDVMWRAAQAVG